MIFHFNDLKVTNNLTYNLTSDSIPWFINTIFCKEKKLCYLCKDINEIDFIQKNVKILNPNINIIKFPFGITLYLMIFLLLLVIKKPE